MQTQQTLTPLGTAGHEALLTERRRQPRINISARASVRGVDASGRGFEAEGELRDISAGGLYVRLAEMVEVGSRITAEVFVTAGPEADFVFTGEVVRSEPLIDLRHGAAVRFSSRTSW